jgi:hypothetical protein
MIVKKRQIPVERGDVGEKRKIFYDFCIVKWKIWRKGQTG